jgi:hypothetical protein
MLKKDLMPKVKAYLDAKPEERNLEEGALMVLQLTNNRIMYQNFMRRPKQYASRIEYELRKKYQFYLQQVTHEEVKEMSAQVEHIVEEHHITSENEEFKKGKRVDHDALPVEIQALYAENLSIMQQMRRLHTQLQLLSVENSTCPDSERYPFLKELIALDKRYHANWERYDHFKVGEPLPEATAEHVEEHPADNTPKKADEAPADETPKQEPTPATETEEKPADATPVKKAAKKPATKKATSKTTKK